MTSIVDNDRTSTFNFSKNHQTLLIDEAGSIDTNSNYGIDGRGFDYTTAIVDGEVSGSYAGYYSGYNSGYAKDATLVVTEDGSLEGRYGAFAYGEGMSVLNSGKIEGETATGLYVFGEDASVFNDGVIRGASDGIYNYRYDVSIDNDGKIIGENHGVYSSAFDGSLTLKNSGTIKGNLTAVTLGSLTEGVDFIKNKGTLISHSETAIDGNNGKQHIVNQGQILGDVKLEGGEDFYFSKRGTVDGVVDGGAGNDYLRGGQFDDMLMGGDGYDIMRGGHGNDKMWGGADSDTLYGNKGNDKLRGDDGNDNLVGGKGNDKMWGGADNDTLEGGRGNDVLWGDEGSDRFVFKGRTDNDVIKDFEAGQDYIDLQDFDIQNFARFERQAIDYENGDAIIDLSKVGGNGTITVENVNDLDFNDFIF